MNRNEEETGEREERKCENEETRMRMKKKCLLDKIKKCIVKMEI